MLKGKQKNLDLNENGKLDAEDFKMLRGEKMKRGGGLKDIGFKNSNLYLYGFGRDTNGNTIVKVSFPNQRAFSIQTSGVLNFTHSKRGNKLSELDSNDIEMIEKEVVDYVKEYGSKDQKSKLKIYNEKEMDGGMMKRGGKAKRSKHAIEVDAAMKAKKPGKRISDAGNVYYEYRPEHSDESRKKKPYLEDGGMMAEGGEVGNEMKETKETNWVYSIGGL